MIFLLSNGTSKTWNLATNSFSFSLQRRKKNNHIIIAKWKIYDNKNVRKKKTKHSNSMPHNSHCTQSFSSHLFYSEFYLNHIGMYIFLAYSKLHFSVSIIIAISVFISIVGHSHHSASAVTVAISVYCCCCKIFISDFKCFVKSKGGIWCVRFSFFLLVWKQMRPPCSVKY